MTIIVRTKIMHIYWKISDSIQVSSEFVHIIIMTECFEGSMVKWTGEDMTVGGDF